MDSGPLNRNRRGRLLVVVLLAGIVSAPLILPWHVESVQARRYGKRYGKKSYASYIARCKRGCNATGGTIKACARALLKRGKDVCKAAYKADAADCTDRSCRKVLKSRLNTCKNEKKNEIGSDRKTYSLAKCGRCCQKTRGQGSCQSYLQGSRFYGSSRYHGRVNCVDSYVGSPSGAFSEVTGTLRDRIRPWFSWLEHTFRS